MNPYYRGEELPDSQDFFPDTGLETVTNSDKENDNEDSQSLISPKLRQSRKVRSNAATVDCRDLSNRVLGSNSETFFDDREISNRQAVLTETQNNVVSDESTDKKRKRKIDNISDNEEPRSLIIGPSKYFRSNEASSSAMNVDYSDHNPKIKVNSKKESNDHETKNDINCESENSENGDKLPIVTCAECIFDKELDKRNYYFGNLLIGELQFLSPCMRSEAFVAILRYVDSLKHMHRKRDDN